MNQLQIYLGVFVTSWDAVTFLERVIFPLRASVRSSVQQSLERCCNLREGVDLGGVCHITARSETMGK